ncbi:helix-turn-helix transcriptional regulator [Puniceicoccales bacterium CK1056]|uniref:Helix-turn-helix transcriptional regulator n=1 Tax=Oceanipulchritudo coccoides TaxID=2706888 RepID=A0A6B2M6V8_9BACT|nr:helix-turn-helix transcriptional regulator [Oceanipulchritudo coccoides]
MKTGRPSLRPRPPFGSRLHCFREGARLTQAQVAEKLGISTRAYAFWEREPVSIRPEQLVLLADIFDVSTDELCGRNTQEITAAPIIPSLRNVFRRASLLSSKQQSMIAEFVGAFVTACGK